jgi:hypothetical protein
MENMPENQFCEMCESPKPAEEAPAVALSVPEFEPVDNEDELISKLETR